MLNYNHDNMIILYAFSLLILIKLFKFFIAGENNNLTCGEINRTSIKSISMYCIDRGIPIENFIDLRCGNGETLVYAIQNGFANAKGTEIVQDKYNNAMNVREKLDSYMKDKIKLSNNNIFELKPDYFPPDSVIFINNSTFSESTNHELIKHLSKVTPSGIIIILSKIPNNLYKFKLIEQLDVPINSNLKSNSNYHVIRK